MKQARLIQSGFSISFSKRADIRRYINGFEDALALAYGQPQALPVPDEVEPAVPRVVFASKNGHSQIAVSQVSVSLTVRYSEDWQEDRTRAIEYLTERIPLVFRLAQIANVENPSFVGFQSRVHVECEDTESPASILDSLLLKDTPLSGDNLLEVQVRTSRVVDSRFFDNRVVQDYRLWPGQPPSEHVPLPAATAISTGIAVTTDMNDRFAFNEGLERMVDAEYGVLLVKRGMSALEETICMVEGAS